MHEQSRFDEPTRRWLRDLAGAGSVVLVRDEHRHLVYLSDNVQTATGWSDDDFVERLYSLVHPDDQSLLFDASRDLRERGVERSEFPLRVLRPDGGFRWFHCRMENRLHDPQVRGLVSRLDPLGAAVPAIERHLQLLTTTNEIVLVFDREQQATYVSPSVEHILGVTPDELVRRWSDVLPGEDQEAFEESRRRVMASRGSETQLRLRVRRADGAVRILDTVVANRFDDEAVGGLLVSARDVTTLVETEQRLGRTEAYFETMVEASPDVFALLEADGAIRYASPGVTSMLGFEVEEVIGRTPLDFVDPADAELAEIELARLASKPGGTTHVLLRLRRKDGEAVWAEASSRNELDRPDLRALVTTLRDVTERIDEQQRMERLLHDSSSVAFVVDREFRITWRTPGVERFIGGDLELRPDELRARFHSEEDIDLIAAFEQVAAGAPGTTRNLVGRLETADGNRWVDLTMSHAYDDPAISGVIVSIRDVDDAVRATEAGQRLDQVLGSTTDLVFVSDRDAVIIWANPAASAVFGEPPVPIGELLDRMPGWARAVIDREVTPALVDTSAWSGELALVTDGDDEVPVEVNVFVHRDRQGHPIFTSVFGRDISDRKVLEEQLDSRTKTDPLTGLPNREWVTERLEELLRDGHDDLAVAVIDLDQFKGVNSSQGHEVGDQLLVAVAGRLRNSVEPPDLVARFGGDEFVVVFTGVGGAEDAHARLLRIVRRVRGLFRVGGIDVFVTASAGVAVADHSGARRLVADAETAMFAAKSAGRDQTALFSDDLRDRSLRMLETAHDLRSALHSDELEVWYQPIVTTEDQRPVGLEALVRWRHPEHGLLSPAQFVPVAEETGLIVPLGSSVIRKACKAVGGLNEGFDLLTVSVNISAYQLADPELPKLLASCMEEHELPAGRLTCEITESAVMQDVAVSTQVLDQIRSLGIGIAVDDFGTGYSSLAYLHRFPVDVLKIDREFTRDLSLESNWEHSLAAGIVSLAHSLDLVVVGEGVETEEQAEILGRLHCDALQGFLFGRPTPQGEVGDVVGQLHRSRGGRR